MNRMTTPGQRAHPQDHRLSLPRPIYSLAYFYKDKPQKIFLFKFQNFERSLIGV